MNWLCVSKYLLKNLAIKIYALKFEPNEQNWKCDMFMCTQKPTEASLI